jgi:hypothetical protein
MGYERLQMRNVMKRVTLTNDIGRYILISEEEAKETLIEPFGDISQFWSPRRGGYVGGQVNRFARGQLPSS